MESIAAAFGFSWQKLWTHPDNYDLRQRRQNPNVLLPGDIVSIPDLTLRLESCATERRHRFVLKNRTSKLVIVLKDFDRPRAGENYVLTVEGKVIAGTTGQDGRLEAEIPPGARTGTLLVGPPDAPEEFHLKLGHIDPIDETTGLQARLNNLGHLSLADFQKKCGLEITGQPDETTLAKLRDQYGC